MSNDGSETTGVQAEDVFARAQWLLDHPEEGERLVGEMLARQGEAVKRQRIQEARALFASLCEEAQAAGQLPVELAVDPTRLEITGHDQRTGKALRFVLSFPPEQREAQQDSSREMPVEGA
ncbi:MAG: hypothetical protein PHX93_05470 [Candidatus Peribacteraceae bacterium]|jgi:hypothetical protein|nr:hypothetical protein [Candidatus Peribacteraceae bacterium]